VDEEKNIQQAWVTTPDGEKMQEVNLPLKGDPVMDERFKAWKKQDVLFTQNVRGSKLQKHIDYVSPYYGSEEMDQMVRTQFPDIVNFYCANFSHGYLHLLSETSLKQEEEALLVRFTQVFKMTYNRFLDLKKAEAQVREAQIEAALERIRARALAMHSSEELYEVARVLREQMGFLGQPDLEASVVHLYPEGSETFESWYAMRPPGRKKGKIITGVAHFPIKSSAVAHETVKAYHAKPKEYTLRYRGAKLKEWMGELAKQAPEISKSFKGEPPKQHIYHFSDFSGGSLLMVSQDDPTQVAKDLQRRAASVFDLAYRRFFDLRQAEEQAREAQIEAALERVRASSMAMHRSEDLVEVATVLHNELRLLNVREFSETSIVVHDEPNRELIVWGARTGAGSLEKSVFPLLGDQILQKLYDTWRQQEDFFTLKVGGAALRKHQDFVFPKASRTVLENKAIKSMPDPTFFHCAFFCMGYLELVADKELSEDSSSLLVRFAKVFDQAYTRFLDLQKAEAQAREAQVEAALERVRAQTMAMHSSEDIGRCTLKMFDELTSMGVDQGTRFGIGILNHNNEYSQLWTATKAGGDVTMHIGNLDMNSHALLKSARKAWIAQQPLNIYVLEGKDLQNYYQILSNAPEYKIPIAIENLPDREVHYGFVFDHGFFYAFTPIELEPNLIRIIQRFSSVFGQTYRRYLDLVTAEEQAKEAQIEAALERIRAKAMAMHNSEDVGDATTILFEELQKLGIETIRCGVGIFKDEHDMEIWSAVASKKEGMTLVMGHLNMKIHPVLIEANQSWNAGESRYSYLLKDKDLQSYYQAIYNQPEYRLPHQKDSRREQTFQCTWYREGGLFAITKEPLTEETFQIFDRFGKVFQLTYRRYLDLKEAEAKAREAQIEASLERVRAKAMAMHSPEDLVETVNQVFGEFDHLEISFLRCGILRFFEDRTTEVYSYSKTEGDIPRAVFGTMKFAGHEMLDGAFEHWILQKEFIMQIKGEAVKRYYQLISSQVDIPNIELKKPHTAYGFVFPEGALYVWTTEQLPPEHLEIMRRFRTVLELTYRRYIELQEAEIREKEAIKQSSLDRVRGEIASMRSTKDLERITPLVWEELTALGVPFFRCGIFIIREEEKMVHAYLSTPTGDALAALHIGFDEKDIGLIKPSIDNWRKQEVYSEEWDQQQFIENMQRFLKRGHIESQEKYQAGDKPPEKLVLQLVPFKQGMLYAGNSEPMTEEHIELMKDLATAFSIAYSRYEDFVQLEKAKQRVENTLGELKSTQTQLVHSEKMASLGELTAGIAHEIQNPLNFVNNFSDINKELAEELMEEIKNGNAEEAKAIIADIIGNEEKIHHHGKRAEEIVRSMLLHSRGSSGEKELTDINALADEYLRLSFHGMRAKDKSFNADFKLELEEGLPKLKVVQQDIGRVLLNLINNAFYATNEKRKTLENGRDYKPTVILTTRKDKDLIEISLKDNGSGIPKNVLDKIFQPFFSTKPTGQGTGLGLSLSFDIITKGHGGTIDVKSKVGKGTEFIIKLPIN
jgi:signal transduction histidine kinase/uncharacterized glyoxalase superfamily protein PhnB